MPRPSSISSSASVKPDFSAPAGAAAQRHAHRAELRGRARAASATAAAVRPRRRRRDLVHQYGAGDARRRSRGVCRRSDVVGDDGDLHRDALGASQLGSQAEVQPVAGVVLDDQQGPVGPGRGADGRQHRIGGRRGEYRRRPPRSACRRRHSRRGAAPARDPPPAGNHGPLGPPQIRRRAIAAHQHMLIAQDGRPGACRAAPSSISRTSPDGSLMSFFIVGPPQNEKALAKSHEPTQDTGFTPSTVSPHRDAAEPALPVRRHAPGEARERFGGHRFRIQSATP